MQPSIHAVRHLSLNRFALLMSALGAATIIGVLSLMIFSDQPDVQRTASSSTAVLPADDHDAMKEKLMIEHGLIRPAPESNEAILQARTEPSAVLSADDHDAMKEKLMIEHGLIRAAPESNEAILQARTESSAVLPADDHDAMKEKLMIEHGLIRAAPESNEAILQTRTESSEARRLFELELNELLYPTTALVVRSAQTQRLLILNELFYPAVADAPMFWVAHPT